MPDVNPELHAAIEAAKERIKVESYYAKAMNSGLKGNAQGYFGGTALGLVGGVIAGGLLTFAFPAVSAIGLVLGLASVGGTIGAGIGARIGAGSGAIAGVFAEKERREKAEKLEQEILGSPEKQREVIEAYRANPVVSKDDTLQEALGTSRNAGEGWRKIFNFKAMAVSIAICSLVSVCLFAGPFMLAAAGITQGAMLTSGIASGLGFALHSGVEAALVGLGTGTAMGVGFGINYPAVFASLAGKTGDLLSGNIFRGETSATPFKTAPQALQEAAMNRVASEQAAPAGLFKSEMPATQVASVQYDQRVSAPRQQLAV